VAVDCLKQLDNYRASQSVDGLGEKIDNYKIQLGKYHKILLLELKHDQSKSHLLISEKVLRDHK